MENKLNNLFQRFRNKGFLPIEIPDLVKDALYLMENDRYLTISAIDRELEDLGWGFNIMDFATFELISTLVETCGLYGVERHIRNG